MWRQDPLVEHVGEGQEEPQVAQHNPGVVEDLQQFLAEGLFAAWALLACGSPSVLISVIPALMIA
jgi:hypothetical protein